LITLVWYNNSPKVDPQEIPYYPTIEQLFDELRPHSNTNYVISPVVFKPTHDIVTPLKDTEVEEKFHARLYLQPFKVDLYVTLPKSSHKSTCKEYTSPNSTHSKVNLSQWKKILKNIKLTHSSKQQMLDVVLKDLQPKKKIVKRPPKRRTLSIKTQIQDAIESAKGLFENNI